MVHLGKVQPARNFLRIILLLAIASFALVLVVLYVSFARATVVLYPVEQPAEVKYSATIDASKSFDPAKLDFVAGRVETVQKQGSKVVSNVGEKPIPDYAQVSITIHNNQGGSQQLLPNSQLLTADGIKFLTDEAVTVPAGGSVTIGATAAEPGKEYNIEPSRFDFIKL
ncbi:MAG: baseplate J/gp47 family protein, partial [bacterium]|nr:baseplate J/gp47 family protein [bacterium]